MALSINDFTDSVLVYKGMCDKGCECECNKSRDMGQYLDYKNCKYKKKTI